MKSLFIFLLAIIFLSNLVSAGVIYTLDFSNNPVQEYTLSKRDMVKFDLKGEQKVYLYAINEIKQRVGLTIFVEGAETPFYFVVTPQQHLRLDFDRDKNTDMYLGVKNMNSEKATLIFEVEKSDNTATGGSIINIPFKYNIKGIIITVSIIIIGLLIYFILKRKRYK